ncbi:non-specific lipid-transfer protein 1-like [Salvia hispanica]|uniref:non-specific lipid-transfer protein 1-like n=1 Tax=Salvia hispanica TaxID=49212 RepID=UPI002009CE3F|nr:non-specific lipid-transfer protein 1-like [Salvia hispanica]
MAGIMKQVSTILMAMVLMAAVAEAEITCGTVLSHISVCIPYVTNKGPIGACCNGVKSLNDAAKTTPDRQAVCNCLKNMATSTPSIDYGKAAGLPKECGVDIPYIISPDIDCSKVK